MVKLVLVVRRVMCDVDGTEDGGITVEDAIPIKEEFSVKVEDAIDIKGEIPETITFTPIKTEREVRLWCVCVCVCVCVVVVVATRAFMLFMVPKRKL